MSVKFDAVEPTVTGCVIRVYDGKVQKGAYDSFDALLSDPVEEPLANPKYWLASSMGVGALPLRGSFYGFQQHGDGTTSQLNGVGMVITAPTPEQLIARYNWALGGSTQG